MTILSRATASTVLVGALLLAAPASADAQGTPPAPAAAAGDAGDLIAVDPVEVRLSAPAPGHVDAWTMTARNVTDREVGLGLDVLGVGGEIFGGPHPLRVTVHDADGAVLLSPQDVVDGGTLVALPALAAGAEYVVTGEAAMPAAADDAYRGAGGGLVVRFVATADPGELRPEPTPTPGEPTVTVTADPGPTTGTAADPGRALPRTGAEILTLAAAALAVVALGTTVVGTVRRRRSA